jgi:hypothetical protein
MISLGQVVEDITTGYAGYATQRLDLLNGSVQYAVQPAARVGEAYPDGANIDELILKVVSDGIIERCIPPAAAEIPLGSKVRDIATGLEGITIVRTTFINGCVYYTVAPKVYGAGPFKGHRTEESFIAQTRLKVVSVGISKVSKVAKRAPRGGPTTKLRRMA